MRQWIGVITVGGLVVVGLLGSRGALASSSTITVSEVQTGSAASASQEFVEFYNQSDHDISLAGWSLDYKSATGAS